MGTKLELASLLFRFNRFARFLRQHTARSLGLDGFACRLGDLSSRPFGLHSCLRRLPAVLGCLAGVGLTAEIFPFRLAQVNVVVVGCLLDVGKSQLPLFVGYALYLVKARDRISDVRRICEGLLSFLRKREDAVGQVAPFGQITMLFVWSPSGLRHTDPPFRACLRVDLFMIMPNWSPDVTRIVWLWSTSGGGTDRCCNGGSRISIERVLMRSCP